MAWPSKRWNNNETIKWLASEGLPQLPASHPLRVTVRASTLAVSLAVIPSIIPLITSRQARKGFKLSELLKREFGPNGYPFGLLVAFAGSAWLEWAWNKSDTSNMDDSSKEQASTKTQRKLRTALCTFVASLWAIQRLQKHPKPRGRIAEIPLMFPVNPLSSKTSPSLDLSIIFAVRALDALFQRGIATYTARSSKSPAEAQSKKSKSTMMREHLDVLLFTLATSRIMWCFIYQPFRLPQSYVNWINALANIDNRLLLALRAIRAGTWKYQTQSDEARHILMTHAQELGYPASWGDPALLPGTGGPKADEVWRTLGVTSRSGRGGVPCELVHGDLMTSSCTANAGIRWVQAFTKALLIYLPVHTIPTLLVDPKRIIKDPFAVISAVSRSSAFLATFISAIFSTICLSRTIIGPRVFPNLSHQTIDGSSGGVTLGCILCCLSLYIERGRRRGEIALYVLPRAIRTLFKEAWLRSDGRSVQWAERLAFALSCSALVTFAKHDPSSLRGLSQWGLGFIYEGWEALNRKKGRMNERDSVANDVVIIRRPEPPTN
ncbi:hypothetical protein M408DRAFT_88986 [Serendipita vermifera MAFF 305830]|uniref:Transmembrane protein 135 N-terminal domain-containing protein n=1 Tax=Serendipita vermifera MAFF 305830 TaxID=933852 RepID=A0A0C2X7F1_SERVB|nr:hypothetical protein M408DRAFT_88986 [Serendipita vermifera MAFF 305830]